MKQQVGFSVLVETPEGERLWDWVTGKPGISKLDVCTAFDRRVARDYPGLCIVAFVSIPPVKKKKDQVDAASRPH